MRPGRAAAAAIWVYWALCAPARAELLPVVPRAVSLGTSAARDAPVIEYAYGPRAQASLGGELGLYLRRGRQMDLRVSAYGLMALENGTTQMPLPDEVYRLIFGATLSLAWAAPRWLGRRGVLEFSLGLGRQQSGTLGGYTLPEPAPPDGIPFGGGGTFLQPDLAWRAPLGKVVLTLRLDDRIHLPSLALMFGQRVPADAAADYTSDGLINEPSLGAVLRWPASARWQPLLSAHCGLLVPLDASARLGYFARGLLGVSIKGRAGELIPFLSGDAGNGLGVLVNRHELRLSGGLRYAVF